MSEALEALQSALGDRYRIERELGRGGMATVFLAQDLKHGRQVALKVLRADVAETLGPERFHREIEIAANLQHPHILAVHDSGDAAGFLYYVMPYVQDESLRDRLNREKQLPVEEALRFGAEVADALGYAHAHGVIHRDIKPENILLLAGHAVVADFGIARAVARDGGSQFTRPGVALGTPAYMSPEQITGSDALDGRADVYALGCVLYELLAGEPPFTGPSAETIARQHLLADPPDVTHLRPAVSPQLAAVLSRAMAKSPADRFDSAASMGAALQRVSATGTVAPNLPGVAAMSSPRAFTSGGRRAPARLALAALLVMVLGALTVPGVRTARSFWARSYGLPHLQELVAAGDWEAAHRLAARLAASLPGEQRLSDLRSAFSDTIALVGEPAGARVYRRPYGGVDDEWEYLGAAPASAIVPRMPVVSEFRFEADGWATAHHIAWAGLPRNPRDTVRFTLQPAARAPAGMVRISHGRVSTGDVAQLEARLAVVPDFWLGRHEVTNREYQEFVDAGGYRRRDFWENVLMDGDVPLAFEAVLASFVDLTGRPGPATWEAGRYPAGQGDHPVAGVSWYEAAAYANYRGRRLPNVFEWLRAADFLAAGAIIPASNIANVRAGTAPVGSFRGMSGWGALDMAGNVREWCFNESPATGGRYALGGSWEEPAYSFYTPATPPPLNRSHLNGIRLALSIPGQPQDSAAERAIGPLVRDYARETPVADEVFSIYRGLFAYDPLPLHEKLEVRDATDEWIVEKVSFNAAYGSERVVAYLYLPRRGRPPYQTVIYFPTSWAVSLRSSARLLAPDAPLANVDFLIDNGRAVVLPVLSGTYERGTGRVTSDPDESHAYRDWVIRLRQDIGRTLDYLATRPDIDTAAIGYMGTSWGARMGPIMLATEPRFKAAVLAVAGLHAARPLPEVDDFNYLPRVRAPVLMLNGRYDPTFPLETHVRPMYELLGTPREHKVNRIVEGAHFVPRHDLIRETLAWFDRYLAR